MQLYNIAIFVLIVLGGCLLFDIAVPWPTIRGKVRTGMAMLQQAGKDREKKETAKDYVRRINGKTTENLAVRSQREAKAVFEQTGQRGRYKKTLQASLAAAIGGLVLGLWLKNPFLAIVLAVGFYFLPLWWTRFALYRYDQAINDELETALSLITTSYTRNSDILTAVSENLNNINEPVKSVFVAFCNNLRYVDPNAPAQIERMKGALDNPIWRQWCDSLILCQADHTLRDTLAPIVNKFSDLKAQQEENATKMMLPLRRAVGMIGLTLGVVPIFYMSNRDWYNNLVSTTFGQIALVITAIVVLVTINSAIKLSKPIQYDV